MFSNIGGKLKGLAKVMTVLGIIGSVIYGVAYGAVAQGTGSNGWLLGIAIVVGGVLLSWVSNMALYGLGELVESSRQTAEQTRRLCEEVDAMKKQN